MFNVVVPHRGCHTCLLELRVAVSLRGIEKSTNLVRPHCDYQLAYSHGKSCSSNHETYSPRADLISSTN